MDTSVLISGGAAQENDVAAISVISIGELHFGLLVTDDPQKRAERAARLGVIQSRFPRPLPVDDHVAREWGRLQSVVVARGGQPRGRQADLILAATANVHRATLITLNAKDFTIVSDIVDIGQA